MSLKGLSAKQLKAALVEAEAAEARNAQVAERDNETKEEELDTIFGVLVSKVENVLKTAGVGSRNRHAVETVMTEARLEVRQLLLGEDADHNADHVTPAAKSAAKRTAYQRAADSAEDESGDSDHEPASTGEKLSVVFPVSSPITRARIKAQESATTPTPKGKAKNRGTSGTSKKPKKKVNEEDSDVDA